MTDQPKIQGTLLFGDWNFTIRVDTADELQEAFTALATHAGQIAKSSVEVKQAVLGQSTMAGVAVTTAAPPAMQASTPPGTPQTNPKQACAHGARSVKTGESSRGPWTGYFCPLQKGDPNQCKPIFG